MDKETVIQAIITLIQQLGIEEEFIERAKQAKKWTLTYTDREEEKIYRDWTKKL